MFKSMFKLQPHHKVFVAGHQGLLGSALVRELERRGHKSLLLRTRAELDLRNEAATEAFFHEHKPDVVLCAAAVVGGIQANSNFPVEFSVDNIRINTNILRSAHAVNTEKLVYVGSNCMYPRICDQPMSEPLILTGAPEPTNEAYALAKLSGYIGVKAYAKQHGRQWITVIPASMYGPNDNFDPVYSHVAPALLLRFHKAKRDQLKEVVMWGTGSPRREFLFVDDAAQMILGALESHQGSEALNLGYGDDISIRESAEVVARVTGFQGELKWDTTKPDGAPRKLLDSQRAATLGLKPRLSFEEGMRRTYEWLQRAEIEGQVRGHKL